MHASSLHIHRPHDKYIPSYPVLTHKQTTRGEQTASALESNLSNLESKLDDILASFGISAADLDALGDDDDEGDDGQEEPSRKDGENSKDGVGKGGASGGGGGKEGKGV
jgi:hypothetical protein